jgi:hypothetical protein
MLLLACVTCTLDETYQDETYECSKLIEAVLRERPARYELLFDSVSTVMITDTVGFMTSSPDLTASTGAWCITLLQQRSQSLHAKATAVCCETTPATVSSQHACQQVNNLSGHCLLLRAARLLDVVST